MVEVLGGELRIGTELNMFQELLKEYYYTGFFVGTLFFAFFYLLVWSFLIRILERLGFFRFWYRLEEPDCELDLDSSLGDDYREADEMHQQERDREEEEEPEPCFEDWQDVDEPTPPVVGRRAPIVPDSPLSAVRDCHESNDEPASSEDDWEDIFYPAANGAMEG